jgi:hypothetical protein
MSVKKLYSELDYETFQEIYNPNFCTLIQNLRDIKFDVIVLTNIKSKLCTAHQLIASFPYTHACIIFKTETPGFKYLHKI